MNGANFETRLRKIEARRVRSAAPALAKHQRDADTAAAATLPDAKIHALAALVTERSAMIRERNAATIEAFFRADT